MKINSQKIKKFFKIPEDIITYNYVHRILIFGVSTILAIVSMLLGLIILFTESDLEAKTESMIFSGVMLIFSFIPFIFIKFNKLYISSAILLFGVNFVIIYRGLDISSAYMYTFLSLILILSALIGKTYVTIMLFFIDMIAIILAVFFKIFTLEQPTNPALGVYYANTITDLLPNIIVAFIIALILQWIFDRTIKKQQLQFQELKQIQEKLIQQEKLESIQTFTGGIAHDFNNLLTSIMGVLSYATECIDYSEEDRDLLGEAENAAKQAQLLTKQLLSFSKGSQPIKELIDDVGKFVEEVVKFFSHGSIVVPQLEFSDDLYSLNADRGQISQVIQNLVINSIQAMSQGGKLHISLKNIDLNEAKKRSLLPDKYIEVIVRDNGNGIPKEIMTHIFEPFYTTKSDGSGLGLHIVKLLIENHGGTVQVSSKVGIGTEFTLLLPAVSRYYAERIEPKEKKLKFSGYVLVMDDDDKVRHIIKIMLSKLGFNAILTTNANEAIKIFEEYLEKNENFVLAFLDMTIPGGKGGSFCFQEIRKLDPTVKVIFSSGYTSDEIPQEIMDMDTVQYLRKPYTIKQLSEVITKLLII